MRGYYIGSGYWAEFPNAGRSRDDFAQGARPLPVGNYLVSVARLARESRSFTYFARKASVQEGFKPKPGKHRNSEALAGFVSVLR